jgi:transposase
MDRSDAEEIYAAGKEAVITTLLQQCERIKKLEKRVASLSQDSTNSSKPPSSDGPELKKRPKKRKSRKKQGGQPGHNGKNRELLPAEKMDKIHEHFPEQCEKCSTAFTDEQKAPTDNPSRYQWFELPKVQPIREEHRCHKLTCRCGCETTADLPKHVAVSSFGPRLHAVIAYLNVEHRVSRRGITEILKNFYNLDIALGSTCNAATRVSEACKPVVEHIKEFIVNAFNLNIDETGWKNKGKRRYLWTFVSSICVYFVISASRSSKVLKDVLGPVFEGAITSDDHSAYSAYHKNGKRQLCWPHLIRKLKALKDNRGSPDAYIFSKNMLKETGRLFTYWHAYRESDCSLEELNQATALIRARMKKYCHKYHDSEDKAVRTRARRTLKNWPHLFTFLEIEGVDPTNNAAERSFRHAVLWRKLCFGSQSDTGERFVERILSVTRTCKMQKRNAVDYLTDVMAATFYDEPLPEILPTTDSIETPSAPSDR